MSPLNFKKSEMGSSSKNLKQSFLPPGALARGRGQSLKSMGSVRVTAEKRTLIDPTNRMLETLRSKSGIIFYFLNLQIFIARCCVLYSQAIEVYTFSSK